MLPSLFTIVLACTAHCGPLGLGAHTLQKRMESVTTAGGPTEALSRTADHITHQHNVPDIETPVITKSEQSTSDASHPNVEPTVPPENILPLHESPLPKPDQEIEPTVPPENLLPLHESPLSKIDQEIKPTVPQENIPPLHESPRSTLDLEIKPSVAPENILPPHQSPRSKLDQEVKLTVAPENILPLHQSPPPKLARRIKSRFSKVLERISQLLRRLTPKNASKQPSRPSLVMQTLQNEYAPLLHTLDSSIVEEADKALAEEVAHQCVLNDGEMVKYLQPSRIEILRQKANGVTPQRALATIIFSYLDGVRQSLKTATRSEEGFKKIELLLADFINKQDTFEAVSKRMAKEKARTLKRDLRILRVELGRKNYLAELYGIFGPETIQAPESEHQLGVAAQEWGMRIDQVKEFVAVSKDLRDPFIELLIHNDKKEQVSTSSTLSTIETLEKRLMVKFKDKETIENKIQSIKQITRYRNLQIEVEKPINSFGFALQFLEPFGIGRHENLIESKLSPHLKYGLKPAAEATSPSPSPIQALYNMQVVAYHTCAAYYGVAVQSGKARDYLSEQIFTGEGLRLFHEAIKSKYKIQEQTLEPQVLAQVPTHETIHKADDHKHLNR